MNTLDREIERFVKGKPYETFSQFDPQTGYQIFRVEWEGGAPSGCEVLIGDTLFNLRSALGQLVFALSTKAGPIPDEKVPEFPIYHDATDFRATGLRRIKHVVGGAHTLIESLQPYNASDPSRDPLRLLNDLHVRDKHRLLHVVDMAAVQRTVMFQGVRAHRYWHTESVRWSLGPVKNGAGIVCIRPRKPIANPDSYVKFDIALDVCFDDGPTHKARVVPTIRQIREYVHREVVARLEAFL